MLLSLHDSATAQVCASPGKDGILSGAATYVNTYYPGNSATVASGADKSITLGAATAVTGVTFKPIAKGDLVLIIQMQGADVNAANTSAYGAGGTAGSGNTSANFTAGQYDYAIATSDVPLTGGTLTVANLTNTYTNADFVTQGARRYQVVRVPQYSSATLGATVTSPAWNGRTGGIVAMDVAGQLNMNSQGIDVSGKGFRGGAGRSLAGGAGTNADYRTLSTVNINAQKGEGTAGTPAYVNNAGVLLNNGIEGYPSGSMGRGAPGNAGGGGNDGNPVANDQNSGGGGGGNGGGGGKGGNSWSSNLGVGGIGGAVFAVQSGSRLVMGGGGGAGTTNDGTGTPANGLASSGAAGGGLVLLRAGSVSGNGSINANGAVANSTASNDGAGGGGAGGSVLVTAYSGLNNITVTARGSNGGSNSFTDPHGPGGGGGGGGGVVLANGTLNAASSIAGGAAGTTAGTNVFGSTPGAAGLLNQNISIANLTNSASGAACLPNLTVTKTTSTPVLTRDAAAALTADYTITIANTGGAAQGLTVQDVLPAGFTFNAHTSFAGSGYSYDDGGNATTGVVSASNTYTGSDAGATTVSYSSFTISAGSSLIINFKVNVPVAVADNTYQNAATVTYLDPTRSAGQRKISPATGAATGSNTTYQTTTSAATVAGSNYVAASGNGEDITVNTRPVPTNSSTSAAMPSTNGTTPLSPLTGTDTSPDTVSKYVIKSVPNATTQGTLYFNGVAVVAGAEVPAAQLGNLTFDPVDAASGAVTFTYSAVDNLGAESAGTATHTLTVVNNQRPETVNITSAAVPNTAVATGIAALQGTDASPGTVTKYVIKSIPNATTQGVLYKGAVIMAIGSDVLAAEANTLRFDPVNQSSGNVTFTYAAVDNNNAEDLTPATYTIPINRAPVAQNVTHNAVIVNTAAFVNLNSLVATDADGTIATFRLSNLPAGRGAFRIQISPGTYETVITTKDYNWSLRDKIEFDPTYSATVTSNVVFNYTVKDAQGAGSNVVTYTVPINVPPVATAATNNPKISTSAPATLLNPLQATDVDGTVNNFRITTLPDAARGILYIDGVAAVANQNYLWTLRDRVSFKPVGSTITDVTFEFSVIDNESAMSLSTTFTIPLMLDRDLDGVNDANDIDSDNDGIPDSIEGTGDTDGDGIPNYLDLDSDGDGIYDAVEANNGKILNSSIFNMSTGQYSGPVGTNGLVNALETSIDSGTINYTIPDTDGDSIPDYLDLDSDNDGILDNIEAQNARVIKSGTDTNRNGVDNSYDPANGGTALIPFDTDGDGIPDYLDLDSDNDTYTDFEEAFDLNNNGKSYDDVTAMAAAFRQRAGANAAAGYYPAPSQPKRIAGMAAG